MEWYKKNEFDHPWRTSNNAFIVLSFEIFLQRTKISQVRKLFDLFSKKFDSPEKVLKNKKEVLSVLNTLGLKHRALRYIKLCEILTEKYNGKVPCSKKDLISLPGVGDYISDAFLNIYCKQKIPLIDRNVSRFLSRYFGLSIGSSKPEKTSIIKEKAKSILSGKNFEEASLALLDFSIYICKPKPRCDICPLSNSCKWKTKQKC